MKTILITLMLVSIPSWAVQNWYPVGKEGAKTVYTKASKCKEAEGQECMDITGKDLRYYDQVDVEVDDYSKPTYITKYGIVQCDDAADCNSKVQALGNQHDKPLAERHCDQDVRDHIQWGPNELMPGYSYWCWRQEGWEKKTVVELQENATTKAAVEAADAASAQQAADLTAVKMAMEAGKEVIALVNMRSAAKDLSSANIKVMLQTYAEIKALLETGALQTARDEIAAITPDATIVTQDDKDAILAELDKYLAE